VALRPTLLLTPDAAGRLTVPAGASVLLPAACYVEEPPAPSAGLAYLGDIWSAPGRGRELARRSAELSHVLARAMTEVITGGPDPHALPLTLDYATHFVEAVLERLARLADAGGGDEVRLSPARLRHALERPGTGRQFKAAQKKQSFQWMLLRLAAGADDELVWSQPSLPSRLAARGRRALWLRRSPPPGSGDLYGARLGRGEATLRALGVAILDVPDLVQPFVVRRRSDVRRRLAGLLSEILGPSFRDFGAPARGLGQVADLFAEMLPPTRLESRAENEARYARYFDRHPVRAFVTATGHGKLDPALFFMAECHRRGRPTVVIQHGGQYGYDDKLPSFFTMDLGLPSIFVSWGWTRFPGPYDPALQKARIVPLPEPRLSELRLRAAARVRPAGPPTLLVPLSKFRTLDNRVGGNATDGVVAELRRGVQETIEALRPEFERFIVTYRSGSFETDPLRPYLAGLPAGTVELLDSRQAPASSLLARAHAVLWDVTATGLFETVTGDVPTVALFRRGRWAAEAAWAETLMREAGIAAYDGAEAAASLRRFVGRPEEWERARAHVQPVLDAFARADDDYRARWKDFLESL
jgi:hypothetical protein